MAITPLTPLSDGLCLWWKLPLELRNMVYRMVYARDAQVKVGSKAQWEEREREVAREARLQNRHYTHQPFIHAVDRLLVSTQYAIEAYAAYIASNHFDFLRGCNPFSVSFSPDATLRASFEDVTCCTFSLLDVTRHSKVIAAYLPHLKSVTVAAEQHNFEYLMKEKTRANSAELMFDTFDETMVRQFAWFEALSHISGLIKVEFSARSSYTGTKGRGIEEKYRRIRDHNINMIKAVVTKHWKRPREEGDHEAVKFEEEGKMKFYSEVVAETTRGAINTSQRDKSTSQLTPKLQSTSRRKSRRQPKTTIDMTITDDNVPTDADGIRRLLSKDPGAFAVWAASASKRLKGIKAVMGAGT